MKLRIKASFFLLVIFLIKCGSHPTKKNIITAKADSKTTTQGKNSGDTTSASFEKKKLYHTNEIFNNIKVTNEGLLIYDGRQTIFVDTSGIHDSIPCVMLPTKMGFRYINTAKCSFTEPDSFARICVPRNNSEIIVGSSYQELLSKVHDYESFGYECDFDSEESIYGSGYNSSREIQFSFINNKFICINYSSFYFNPGQSHQNHCSQEITTDIIDYLEHGMPFKKTRPLTNDLFKEVNNNLRMEVNREIFEKWALGQLDDDFYHHYEPTYTGDADTIDVPNAYLQKPLLSDTNQIEVDVWEAETRYPRVERDTGRHQLIIYSVKNAPYIASLDYDWTVTSSSIPLPEGIVPLNYTENEKQKIIKLSDNIVDFYVSPKHNLLVLLTKTDEYKKLEIIKTKTGEVLVSRYINIVQMVEWCGSKYVSVWLSELKKANESAEVPGFE